MPISFLLRKILNKLRGKTPAQAEMEYLCSQGLIIGSNFRNHSDYAVDALLPWLISIGDDVCLSTDVKILAHDTSTEYIKKKKKIGTVTIGNRVYVGCGSIILCNVHIGDDVIIGAGSVVTHDVPSNSVYAGNPAHFICTLQEFKAKHMGQLDKVPVFDGPVSKWHTSTSEEKIAMREILKDSFGYMK